MTTTETTPSTSTPAANPTVLRASKRRKKVEGRKKRALKLHTDREFAKQYFAAKSKRSTDKKSAYRKKKSKKK